MRVSGKDWVLANTNMSGYFRVNYDSDNWDRLLSLLNTNHRVSHMTMHLPKADGFGWVTVSWSGYWIRECWHINRVGVHILIGHRMNNFKKDFGRNWFHVLVLLIKMFPTTPLRVLSGFGLIFNPESYSEELCSSVCFITVKQAETEVN